MFTYFWLRFCLNKTKQPLVLPFWILTAKHSQVPMFRGPWILAAGAWTSLGIAHPALHVEILQLGTCSWVGGSNLVVASATKKNRLFLPNVFHVKPQIALETASLGTLKNVKFISPHRSRMGIRVPAASTALWGPSKKGVSKSPSEIVVSHAIHGCSMMFHDAWILHGYSILLLFGRLVECIKRIYFVFLLKIWYSMIWPRKFKYTLTLKIAYLHGFELFDSFNWPDKTRAVRPMGRKRKRWRMVKLASFHHFFKGTKADVGYPPKFINLNLRLHDIIKWSQNYGIYT